MLLTRGKETVERQCIFADMRVDQQSDLRMEFAKSGKCGKRNGHEVANTADIENDLIGTLIEEAAAEQSDHRMKVLLCWSEVSTTGAAVRPSTALNAVARWL